MCLANVAWLYKGTAQRSTSQEDEDDVDEGVYVRQEVRLEPENGRARCMWLSRLKMLRKPASEKTRGSLVKGVI